MFLVGLTGGIATGKSTVSAIFKEHNIPIIDADKIAYAVVEPGKPAYVKLREEFGPEIFKDDLDGTLDREKLGKMVFSDSEVRRKVNNITHPAIRKEIMLQIWHHFWNGAKFVLLDLPLLYEVGYDKILQKVIVVSCTEEQQLSRLQNRNNYDEATAKARISAQMPLKQKIERASYVVDNCGSSESTRRQVEAIIQQLESSRLHLLIRFFIVIVALIPASIALKIFLI